MFEVSLSLWLRALTKNSVCGSILYFSKGLGRPATTYSASLLVPFRLGMSVTTGSETVVTYDLCPHRLALCTRGLGVLGLTPSLEKVLGSFVDHRLFLLELLPGFFVLHNCLLRLGFPTGQGFAHPPEGPFVYF